jgi:hypothetical protein
MINKSEALANKSDMTLLGEVKSLVQREKEIVIEVIEYLREIEVRRLHVARGFSSMFAFATDFLGYSEAEAHIRIQAARLTQALPEVADQIRSGWRAFALCCRFGAVPLSQRESAKERKGPDHFI